jgi:hypothetical protein
MSIDQELALWLRQSYECISTSSRRIVVAPKCASPSIIVEVTDAEVLVVLPNAGAPEKVAPLEPAKKDDPQRLRFSMCDEHLRLKLARLLSPYCRLNAP